MYENILIPIALQSDQDGAAAVEIAKALKSPQGTLTLLHVMEDLPGYVVSQLPEGIGEENRAKAHAGLEKVAHSVGAPVTARVVSGHSSRTILNEADRMSADCIIIASHRPGLEDYFIGSTAAYVVRHAKCAVHVVR